MLFLLGFLLWVIGAAFSYFLYTPNPVLKLPPLSKNVNLVFDFKFHLFAKIFFNNALVGLLVSIIGFATGGILTAILFVYNGFMLGFIIQNALYLKMSKLSLAHSLLLHGPLEVVSLLYLGAIGFQGWTFYKMLLKNEMKFEFAQLPHLKTFILPFSGLLLAAIIEASI